MAIREFMNKHPERTKGAAIIVIILALGVSIWHTMGGTPANASKAYYTTDDGATTFVDDFFKAYPFDHGGKPAYRAYVYQTADGKQFVGYLERFTTAGIPALQSLLSTPGNREQIRDQIQGLRSRYTELKAAKDSNAQWYRVGSHQADVVQSTLSSSIVANQSAMLVFP